MTSGVRRASVRSRFRCRMISWPAAKLMRCVNPSIATVSPSRTRSAIASDMDATLDAALDLLLTRSMMPAAAPVPCRGRAAEPSAGRLDLVERAGLERLGFDGHVEVGDRRDGLGEQPQSGRHLGLGDRERRGHANARPTALEDQEAILECLPLDRLGMLGRVELDADHQAL